MNSIDLVTDRNNIRKLLSFVNPTLSRDGLVPFIIDVEVTKNTAIFGHKVTDAVKVIGPADFVGYGHEFEKAYSTSEVENSTGHHRIDYCRFGDLALIIRYETDGYVGRISKTPKPNRSTELEGDDISKMIESMSLSSVKRPTYAASAGSKLMVKKDGKAVPRESILEIKTRVIRKHINLQEVLPQLWVSQTPNIVRALWYVCTAESRRYHR
jgi:hypothetical protein